MVVKEAEEILFARPLKSERKESIKTVTDGCRSVLNELKGVVEKYQSLATDDKRARDRIGFANQDVAEFRARITSNITMVNVLIKYVTTKRRVKT